MFLTSLLGDGLVSGFLQCRVRDWSNAVAPTVGSWCWPQACDVSLAQKLYVKPWKKVGAGQRDWLGFGAFRMKAGTGKP